MAAMTEQHIVEIEGSNQVLGALALLLPHLMKAEAIECVRARIIVLHAVYQGLRGTDNEGESLLGQFAYTKQPRIRCCLRELLCHQRM